MHTQMRKLRIKEAMSKVTIKTSISQQLKALRGEREASEGIVVGKVL